MPKANVTFHFVEIDFDAPNPCFSIEGVGDVGLPLSERDARHIIPCFLKDASGDVEMDVQSHQWTIEPSRLTFKNLKWTKWLEKIALRDVCASFGVTSSGHKPRLDSRGLFLLSEGSG